MRVNQADLTSDKPVWRKDFLTVEWNGRTFPIMSFYMIHKVTKQFLNILESDQESNEDEKVRSFTPLMNWYQNLSQSVQNLFASELWCESFNAWLAMQRWWWEDDEVSRYEAILKYHKLRLILNLDELFAGRAVAEEVKQEGVRSLAVSR